MLNPPSTTSFDYGLVLLAVVAAIAIFFIGLVVGAALAHDGQR